MEEEEEEVDVSSVGRMATSHMNVLKEAADEVEVVAGMEVVVVAEVVDVSNVEKTDTRHINVLEEEVVEDLEDSEVVDIEDGCDQSFRNFIWLFKISKRFMNCKTIKCSHLMSIHLLNMIFYNETKLQL